VVGTRHEGACPHKRESDSLMPPPTGLLQLFDPEGPWSCLHERQAFLTYGTRLSEADVMALAGFGRLMRTRAYGELASHKVRRGNAGWSSVQAPHPLGGQVTWRRQLGRGTGTHDAVCTGVPKDVKDQACSSVGLHTRVGRRS
jgi:hypothetical protein